MVSAKSLDLFVIADMWIKIKDTGKHNPWFFRKLNALSTEDQERVWKIVEDKGYERYSRDEPKKPDPVPEKKKNIVHQSSGERVYWDEDEWDRLADLVWSMRQKDPIPALAVMANRAVCQFPKERRRTLTAATIGPLVERLKKKSEDYRHAFDMQKTLEQRLAQVKDAPTKEQIIGSLNDDEVLYHFSNRVLALLTPEERLEGLPHEVVLDSVPVSNLAGHVVTQLIDSFLSGPEQLKTAMSELGRHINNGKPGMAIPALRPDRPVSHTPKRLKVAVFGAKANQHQALESALGDRVLFNFVDKNRRANLPTGQDIYVVWSRYCSHAIEEQLRSTTKHENSKIVRHFGGVTQMIGKIEELINGVRQVHPVG